MRLNSCRLFSLIAACLRGEEENRAGFPANARKQKEGDSEAPSSAEDSGKVPARPLQKKLPTSNVWKVHISLSSLSDRYKLP